MSSNDNTISPELLLFEAIKLHPLLDLADSSLGQGLLDTPDAVADLLLLATLLALEAHSHVLELQAL